MPEDLGFEGREGGINGENGGAAPSAEKLQKLDQLLEKTALYAQFLDESVRDIDGKLAQAARTKAAANSTGDEPARSKRKPSEPSDQTKSPKKRKASGSSSYADDSSAPPSEETNQREREPSESTAAAVEQKPMSETRALLPLMNGELRDYQLRGVRWLISLYHNGMNGVLADEMGLGKTVQTVGFLSFMFHRGIHGPFIVLAPLSTLPNWKSEFERWCPSMSAILYHGNKDERSELQNDILRRKVDSNFPTILTSYEVFMRDRAALNKLNYKYLVVDEGHRLKNFDCKLIKQVRQINTDNKLLLTGTPLQNRLTELWSLLNFLAPEVFANMGEFQSWFAFGDYIGSENEKVIEAQRNESLVSKLHQIISPYLLRREKKDVESALPKKKEVVLYAQLAEEQRTLTQAYLDSSIESVLKKRSEDGNKAAIRGLNNELMQLRKVCNHPDLLTGQFDTSGEFPSPEKLMKQCGKLQLLERVLERLRCNQHKVLIFSQMSQMLDLLEHVLDQRGWGCCRIDGTVAMEDRQEQIRKFNEDPNTFVFLLTTRAGGLGLNLMAADTAILYDSDFNPHADLQAMDRCHRIGQKKPVHVYRLITSNSIEEKMLNKATEKLMLEKVVVDAGGFEDRQRQKSKSGDGSSQLNTNELQQLLGEFKEAPLAAKSQTISDEDLDMIMDRRDMLDENEGKMSKPSEGVGFRVAVEERANSRSLLGSVQNDDPERVQNGHAEGVDE